VHFGKHGLYNHPKRMGYIILCIRAENNSSQKLSQEGKIEQIAVPNSEVHQAANIERKIAHEARKGSVKSRMQQEPSGKRRNLLPHSLA